MEKVAEGKNFIITPTDAQIFHVSRFRDDNDKFWYRDRFAYAQDVFVDEESFLISIDRYLDAADRMGALKRAKMMLVKPMAALVLHSLDLIPTERFQEITERSNGYFDVPGSELRDNMPVRIAQNPGTTLIIVDERGYPVFGDS